MPVANLSVRVSEKDIADVDALLRSLGIRQGGKKVLKGAINKTLPGVRTDETNEIAKVITPTKKRIRATIKPDYATNAKVEGRVECKGTPLPLIHYNAREYKKGKIGGGVSVQILRRRARKVLKGCFIAAIGKHKGVFQRKHRYAHYTGFPFPPNIPWPKAVPVEWRAIEEMFGSRIPDILSNKPVLTPVENKAADRFQSNFDNQLVRYMKSL